MQRNMDLIRKILQQIESQTEGGSPQLDIPGYSSDEVLGHLCFMEDGGFVHRGEVRLTWHGHEYLEASRDDVIWEKSKKLTLQQTGGLNAETLLIVLLQFGKDAIFGKD